MERIILTNARAVVPGDCFTGSVVVVDGAIDDVVRDRFYPEGIDLQGCWLIPGCVDIHTDQLEREIAPRPNAVFPLDVAVHSLDLRAVSCGLTTVFSCVRFSLSPERAEGQHRDPIGKVSAFEQAVEHSMARHFVQARWDTNCADNESLIDGMRRLSRLKAIVYNESIPGERQFRDMIALARKLAERRGISEDEAARELHERRERKRAVNNRATIQREFGDRCLIGSHDDTTVAHVDEAREYGSTLAEMPCTIEAARRAKELGMWVCMGASNYVRGSSSYGNLSCVDAMAEGLVDMLCSDYHFPTLLNAFVKMTGDGMEPWEASAVVSGNAARCLGLDDELGSIETGKKADLVCLFEHGSKAVVRDVWVDGHQVFSLRNKHMMTQ